MCGIIAIVRGPSYRRNLDAEALIVELARAVERVASARSDVDLGRAADALDGVDVTLRGPSGIRLLATDPGAEARVAALVDQLTHAVDALSVPDIGPAEREIHNRVVERLRDRSWALSRDRLRTARSVRQLIGDGHSWPSFEVMTSVHQALAAIDRLEVRGRDSAGLLVTVDGHGLDLTSPDVLALIGDRPDDRVLRAGAVRVCPDGSLLFAFKAAAEIGELGDNTAELRAQVLADELLRLALDSPEAQATVLGHTRWASVGIVSQANAHPLDSLELTDDDGPLVAAALNGDIDNYADLKSEHSLAIAPEITTDAKVIPALISRRLVAGASPVEAFRTTVGAFEGSVAIAATATEASDQVFLALRGSGQALYVGLADGAYVVASEPYGLVEETSRYLRMDGETPANPDNPTASRGQIIVLDRNRAGRVEGIERVAYDGTAIPVGPDEIVTAEITTRDIDRGDAPHFLLKEIRESPESFRKTLQGRLVPAGRDGGPDDGGRGGSWTVQLEPGVVPDGVAEALQAGEIRRILAIGQGTAHLAGQGLAAALDPMARAADIDVDAVTATELSGFGLRPDMSDTLVVAISQSGTTTDTNRTVDLIRARGAKVIAIVNRRNSDLTDRVDGVLYTSDGRDVEMAVPSTKAFYSQIAAGFCLAAALGEIVGHPADDELLAGLAALPDAMTEILGQREDIGAVAARFGPPKRYWAVVGNGDNYIAARELRVKLSELCYKSIACDATEDKKHIDLAAEPLIIVCAAGLSGSNADDVAKEVAIYRAHKATPIVIATRGEQRYAAASAVIDVPECHPALAFVLITMAGHLFGYEAALAIDAQARPLRQIRAVLEGGISAGINDAEALLDRLDQTGQEPIRGFLAALRVGEYDGHLEASTGVRIASLLRYAVGALPLDHYQLDHGKIGTPAVVIEDLEAALSAGIDQLTRPVDAIKHQAKTVTVGISRSDETFLAADLVQAVMAAGAPRDRLTYTVLRTLANVDPAIEAVTGHSRYALEPSATGDLLTVIDRGGIAAELPTRADRDPHLRGTKKQVADQQQVLVGLGRSDGRSIVIVPEIKEGATTGMTLLHVRFADRLSVAAARGVLDGYRGRLSALTDAVMETEPTFRPDLLAEIDVVELLTAPISVLADRWRASPT